MMCAQTYTLISETVRDIAYMARDEDGEYVTYKDYLALLINFNCAQDRIRELEREG